MVYKSIYFSHLQEKHYIRMMIVFYMFILEWLFQLAFMVSDSTCILLCHHSYLSMVCYANQTAFKCNTSLVIHYKFIWESVPSILLSNGWIYITWEVLIFQIVTNCDFTIINFWFWLNQYYIHPRCAIFTKAVRQGEYYRLSVDLILIKLKLKVSSYFFIWIIRLN